MKLGISQNCIWRLKHPLSPTGEVLIKSTKPNSLILLFMKPTRRTSMGNGIGPPASQWVRQSERWMDGGCSRGILQLAQLQPHVQPRVQFTSKLNSGFLHQHIRWTQFTSLLCWLSRLVSASVLQMRRKGRRVCVCPRTRKGNELFTFWTYLTFPPKGLNLLVEPFHLCSFFLPLSTLGWLPFSPSLHSSSSFFISNTSLKSNWPFVQLWIGLYSSPILFFSFFFFLSPYRVFFPFGFRLVPYWVFGSSFLPTHLGLGLLQFLAWVFLIESQTSIFNFFEHFKIQAGSSSPSIYSFKVSGLMLYEVFLIGFLASSFFFSSLWAPPFRVSWLRESGGALIPCKCFAEAEVCLCGLAEVRIRGKEMGYSLFGLIGLFRRRPKPCGGALSLFYLKPILSSSLYVRWLPFNHYSSFFFIFHFQQWVRYIALCIKPFL